METNVDVSNETEFAKSVLIAYNSRFDANDIEDNRMETGRREIIFFSIENIHNKDIIIDRREWTLIGQDNFLYKYVRNPGVRLYPNFPNHYFSKQELRLSPGTKVKYLIMSKVLPESARMRKIEYSYEQIILEIPNDMPDVVGNPPL
jgi:hypothetical protein